MCFSFVGPCNSTKLTGTVMDVFVIWSEAMSFWWFRFSSRWDQNSCASSLYVPTLIYFIFIFMFRHLKGSTDCKLPGDVNTETYVRSIYLRELVQHTSNECRESLWVIQKHNTFLNGHTIGLLHKTSCMLQNINGFTFTSVHHQAVQATNHYIQNCMLDLSVTI